MDSSIIRHMKILMPILIALTALSMTMRAAAEERLGTVSFPRHLLAGGTRAIQSRRRPAA